MDESYLDAALRIESRERYGVGLYGPVAHEGSWQAISGEGYAASDFVVDWERREAHCPEGKTSVKWRECRDAWGNASIQVRFPRADCAICAKRPLCTHSKTGPREISLRPEEQYRELRTAREHQKTKAFKTAYGERAGIEGTFNQGVRRSGLRRSRYVGQAKTHLQHLLIATALNLVRMIDWVREVPRAQTRSSSLKTRLHCSGGLSATLAG